MIAAMRSHGVQNGWLVESVASVACNVQVAASRRWFGNMGRSIFDSFGTLSALEGSVPGKALFLGKACTQKSSTTTSSADPSAMSMFSAAPSIYGEIGTPGLSLTSMPHFRICSSKSRSIS